MPKFAANLSLIFQEIGFLDRFAAAAACGFKAVEYLSPYEHPPEVIAEQLNRHGLVQALFNMPPGDWAAGERGTAALPGREQEFRDGVEQGDRLRQGDELPAAARDGRAVAGRARPGRGRARLHREFAHAAERLGARRHHRHHRADQHPRHPGLFPQHDDPGDVGHRAGRPPQPETAARPLPCADHGGRSRPPIRALAGRYPHVQIAGNPGRHEPDVGEINYPFLFDLFDELGYSGWIGCEYRPKGETRAGLGWAKRYGIQGLSDARRHHRRLRHFSAAGGVAAARAAVISTSWCCSTTRPRPCRCPRTSG